MIRKDVESNHVQRATKAVDEEITRTKPNQAVEWNTQPRQLFVKLNYQNTF